MIQKICLDIIAILAVLMMIVLCGMAVIVGIGMIADVFHFSPRPDGQNRDGRHD